MKNLNGKKLQQMREDAFTSTEQRLFRLPELVQRIAFNESDLKELKEFGTGQKESSRSIVRLIRPTMRVDPVEARQAQISVIESYIAADKYELRTVKRALSCVRSDPYYTALEYKYFRREPDEAAAEKLGCALTTLRRNRANLVRRVSSVLYGVNGYKG